MKRLLFLIRCSWKNVGCRFLHRNHHCYPDVGGLGLKGDWHCMKCHPCAEALDKILDS